MLYRLDYLNRRGLRVWVIPLAGTTIARDSALLPAVKRLGREPLTLEYGAAIALADRINSHLVIMGMPGRVCPTLVHDLTGGEIVTLQCAKV